MAASLGFLDRLLRVVVPTRAQTLGAIFLALMLLVVAQTQPLLIRLGITSTTIAATQSQFHARFSLLLSSPLASNLALIIFWALVGLVAYLLCWGIYNVFVEARNEVTLNTAYTNRGNWRGAYHTLALKAAAGVGLALVLSSLWFGFSFWLTLTGELIAEPMLATSLKALGAILGFAVQLYLVLAFIQLTFTPWYRAETFTGL